MDVNGISSVNGAVVEHIKSVLNHSIRPLLRAHNGDMELLSFRDGVALMRYHGACASCPSAELSTKVMVEEVLTQEVSEVSSVEIDVAVSDELLDFANVLLKEKQKSNENG